MRTALYIIWFLIPTCFFLLALWAKLEQIGNRAQKQNPGDFLKQAYFVLLRPGFRADRTLLPRADRQWHLPGVDPEQILPDNSAAGYLAARGQDRWAK